MADPGEAGALLAVDSQTHSVVVKRCSLIYLIMFILSYAAISISGLLSQHGGSDNGLTIADGTVTLLAIILAAGALLVRSCTAVPDGEKRSVIAKHEPKFTTDVQFWGILLFGLGTMTLHVFAMTEFYFCKPFNSSIIRMIEDKGDLGTDNADQGVVNGFIIPFFTASFVIWELMLIRRYRVAHFSHSPCNYWNLLHLVGTHIILWFQVFADEIREEDVVGSKAPIPTIYPPTSTRSAGMMKLAEDLRNLTFNCAGVKTLFKDARPILYPFTMEFSLLMAGLLISIWNSITTDGEPRADPPAGPARRADPPEPDRQNKKLEFLRRVQWYNGVALIFAAGIIVFIIVMSAIGTVQRGENVQQTHQAHTYLTAFVGFRMIILLVMLAGCGVTWLFLKKQTRGQLAGDSRDILLIASSIGLFAYCCLSLVAIGHCAAHGKDCNGSGTTEITFLMMESVMLIVQTVIQVGVLMEASRRTLETISGIDTYILRGTMRLLGYLNFLLWVCDTFYDIHTKKSISTQAIASSYFGSTTWAVLVRLMFPLSIFFHFHSSLYFHQLNTSELNVYSRMAA